MKKNKQIHSVTAKNSKNLSGIYKILKEKLFNRIQGRFLFSIQGHFFSVISSLPRNLFKLILLLLKGINIILDSRFHGNDIFNIRFITLHSLRSRGQLKTKNQKLKTTSSKSQSFYKLSLGFTLVELIIVITILAILGTIAFVSFGSYSSQSRDSARVADINSLNKSLELFQLKASKYPDPSGTLTTVTYSGGVLFTQGSLGDSVVKSIGSISKKPVDPLSGSEYTYSVNSTYTKYEIKADFENKLSFSPLDNILLKEKVLADSSTGTVCYIKGNYNSLIEKTNTGNTNYILALPGLISNDTSTNIDYNTLSGKILCNGINTPCNITFNPTVVYSGNSLPTTTTQVNQMMIKLQEAYSGSNSASIIPQIKELLAATGSELEELGTTITKSTLNISVNNNDGVCGSDNGKTLASTPTNLCNNGTPSAITGEGPWSWSCAGINGGSSASCSASKLTPIDGLCGSANGTSLSEAPTDNLCSTGTPSLVTGNGPWSWSCTGINGGNSASCSANPPLGDSSSNPGLTCKDILDKGGNTGNKLYWIKPDSNPAFQVYCDMTTDGGGWTLIYSAKKDSTNMTEAVLVNLRTNNYMNIAKIKAIANLSITIYMTDNIGGYIKSVDNKPILRMREGKTLNGGYGLGVSTVTSWTGTKTGNLSWTWSNSTCYNNVNTNLLPNFYYACGNTSGAHILTAGLQKGWTSSGYENMDIFIK